MLVELGLDESDAAVESDDLAVVLDGDRVLANIAETAGGDSEGVRHKDSILPCVNVLLPPSPPSYVADPCRQPPAT